MEQKKKLILITGVVLGSLLGIYLGVSIYFMNHFHVGTMIGSVDVSGKTAEEADVLLQNTLREYNLTVTERDGNTNTIKGDDIDLKVEWSKNPADIIAKQNGFAWIVKVFTPDKHEINGTLEFDKEKLANKIAALDAMQETKQIPAVDAKVSEYDATKGYTVVPSVPGTVVKVDVLTAKVEECILALNEKLDLVESGCYEEPVIADDNEQLLDLVARLNKTVSTVITYQIGSSTQVLDASVFQPWISVSECQEIIIDDAAVTEYVKGLASTYNTVNKPKTLMTSYGQEVTFTRVEYGWKVDNAKEKEAIVAELLAGEAVTRDLHYSQTAHSREGNDYGNSYVEINLTAQHLFLYVDGVCVLETDFVSGNAKNKWDTPVGAFKLTYKTRNATLRGADYETPVSYWMPYCGNVGMHDAYWRNDFGGSIYKTNGSHGCINLPPAKAQEIYGYIKQGFPVLVYQLEGTQTEKGNAMDQAYAFDQAVKKIGTVTLESEAAIVACRTQYDALSAMAKKYVTTYQKLLDAEATLAALKPAV